jgi:carbonic anhydrase
MRSIYRSLWVIVAYLLLLSCNQEKEHKETQSAQNETAEQGYLIPGLEHGLIQSPINILSDQTSSGWHNVTLNFSGEINMVENLGHTVQLDFEPGNTITFDDKVFEFKQLHFHTPSEHLIDGITYPMEMHAVNTLKDQPKGETTEYLVLAFLVKMGKENTFISRFIDQIPEEAHEATPIDLNAVKESELFSNSLSKEVNSYYYYKGSLTTPPYTESVNWCVLKRIFEASPEQIKRINEIQGDNARHIQAQRERKVSSQ